MPNEFQTQADELNEGDLPFGYSEGDIVPLIVDSLGSYWTFQLSAFGITFEPLTLVPLLPDEPAECPGDTTSVGPGVAVCADSSTVYVDDATARLLYDDPIEGRADFAVGYLIAVGWADTAQTLLGSTLTGEPRALANDCLVGAWTRDLDADRDARPDEDPEERGTISPGDLDEAVLAAITIGDVGFADDNIGSAFEKIGSFRTGVLAGIDACREQLGG
jgi:predicted metalloprotease